MKATTGPRFTPDTDRGVFFMASNPAWLHRAWEASGHRCRYMLTAVNDLTTRGERAALDELIQGGVNVLVDSGIFNLATSHARSRGMHMDQALGLAPSAVDGFDKLWDLYGEIATTYSDRLWGIIELDQGGANNKRETRQRIEQTLGVTPIPVYHPVVDGWDYFDELAGAYDRICFGNVVQASRSMRSRVLATAWERSRAYPHLWVHLLGVTPSPMLYAFPAASCDSSALISPLRYGVAKVMVGGCLSPKAATDQLVYRRDVGQWEKAGWSTAAGLALSTGVDVTSQLRGHLDALERVGVAPWAHDNQG